MSAEQERVKALRQIGSALFGRNNLIGTDFSHVEVHKDADGVTFQFHVTHNAMGKVPIPPGCYDALGLSDTLN